MHILLTGYSINGEIPSIHKNIRILDAIRSSDNHPVVIKLLSDKKPSLEQIKQFKNEYEILTKLKNNKHIPHIINFEKIDHSYAIVFDKIQAPFLEDILKKEKKLNWEEFFYIAIELTKIIDEIHQEHIVHKGINPSNIFYDRKKALIKIVGFGSASQISSERTIISNPNTLEGNLHYISPEQTGRMNRNIDYRSDYYSLGATLYRLLAGKPPFEAQSPLELVHSHIAVDPVPLNKIDKNIPKILSDIILKLMAKNAEQRYQSAQGILHDLKLCQKQFKTGFETFVLGEADVFSNFHMPEKLYGRENEINILLKNYEKASHGKITLVLVEGYAGIGKSVLVNELYKPISQKHGFFVTGKFDQFKHHIPYAAIIQALNEWVQKILTENEEIVAIFKKRILAAVKDNGQIILDVIPALENIIGKQPPVVQLEQAESQNRFNHVFQAFTSAIATEEFPLAVFLDDLQWADLPSLSMLETLLTSLSCKHILIIGAYRSNEVDSTHPLTNLLEKLNKRSVIFSLISLGPLTLENVQELISDLVHRDIKEIEELAKICYQKTNGNAFFLLQLLRTLYQERLIIFDRKENHWIFHLDKIKGKGVSDNVVDLMIDRIQQLPQTLQHSLQYAACIGNRFNLNLLMHVSKTPVEKLFLNMQQLLEKGFIVSGGHQTDVQIYQFAHDRIQQAAHLLLDTQQRNEIHLELARYIFKNSPKNQLNDVIFEIIDHYNFSIDAQMLDDLSIAERLTVANLNLQASKLAQIASAYEPALKYIEYALGTVDEKHWSSEYQLMLDLHTEAVVAAYLAGKHQLMDFYADIVEKRAKNIFDKVKVIQTQVFSYSSQEKHNKALDLIISSLRKLKTKLPRHPNKIQILFAVMKVKFALYIFLLKHKKISKLLDLPEMQDHTKRIAINLLKTSYSPAYLGEPDLFAILVCEATKMSLKYGNAKDSAYPYICFGMICCGVLNDIDTGYELGQMANQLNIKMHDEETATKLNLVLAGFIRPWKEPIKDCLPGLLEAYERGFENGDLEYGCYGAYINIAYSFFAGLPIKPLIPKIDAFRKRFASLQLIQGLQFLDMTNNGILPFIEKNNYLFPQPENIKDISILFNTYNFRLIYSFYIEDYEDALKAIEIGEQYASIVAWQGVPIFYCYYALTLLALYPESRNRKYKKIIKSNLKKLQFWAKHAPGNHLHKALLIEAEILNKINNNQDKAIKLYKQAIETAKKNEHLQEEALANELLAKYFISINDEENAKIYLNEAIYCYLLWGGDQKIAQLKAKYPSLIKPGSTNNVIDKASSDKNIDKQMETILQTAGAQTGYFILHKNGNYTIELAKQIGCELTFVDNGELTPDRFPLAIINYVIKTGENIILDEACNSEMYGYDTYIKNNQSKAILCMPLKENDKIQGLIYLENNLTIGAFTESSIEAIDPIAKNLLNILTKKS